MGQRQMRGCGQSIIDKGFFIFYNENGTQVISPDAMTDPPTGAIIRWHLGKYHEAAVILPFSRSFLHFVTAPEAVAPLHINKYADNPFPWKGGLLPC